MSANGIWNGSRWGNSNNREAARLSDTNARMSYSNQPEGGLLTMLVRPVTDSIREHAALPPLQKNIKRAASGTTMVSFCAYLALGTAGAWDKLPPLFLVGWAACTGFGLLWIAVGVHGSRGTVDIMGAFWAVVAGVGFGCLLVWRVYLPADWGVWGGSNSLGGFLLRGMYLSAMASSAMRCWCNLRGLFSALPSPIPKDMPRRRLVQAGDASEADTLRALRGGKANQVDLDDMDF